MYYLYMGTSKTSGILNVAVRSHPNRSLWLLWFNITLATLGAALCVALIAAYALVLR